MTSLPSASTRVDETAGPSAAGTKYLAVMAPVASNADAVPRLYSSSASMYQAHGYAPGVDYCALHFSETKLPVLFVPLPIATPGVVGRINQSGNSNTSAVSVAVGSSGSLEETDGVVEIVNGGVVGTDQISFKYSLDNGVSYKQVKLGTASSYTIPYVGLVLSFGGGSLTAGDVVLRFHSTAPMCGSAGIALAKTNLAKQKRQTHNWLVVGDVSTDTEAGYVSTAANAYETETERYVLARVQCRDRLPRAEMSDAVVAMSGNPSVTFAEVGATGDTITRSTGSFVADGFCVGDTIRVSGSASNNVSGVVAGVSALVLTLDTTDLVAEGPVSGVRITGEPTLTFAEVGATGDTITRNRGSWIADGFRVGDSITVSGSASNNVTGALAGVSALVLTMGSTDLAAEVIGSSAVALTAGETIPVWLAALDAEMAPIASEKRVSLGVGRRRKLSPFLDSMLRRPVQWADTLRSFQHDLHIPAWKKNLGPLNGWTTEDTDDEHDERSNAGALAAGFTCFRTWSNGPDGQFIALSLTRANPDSVFSRAHNMAVVNMAQSVCQAETENAIGESLILNADGTAEQSSLNAIKQRVDSALKRNLLANLQGEGQRASNAYWTPDSSALLNVPGATLNGVLTLNLRGTLEHINTSIKVNAGE